MPCTITDNLQFYTNANVAVPLAGQIVLAVPSSNTTFELVGGSYRFLSINPAITTAPYFYGRTSTTDSSGTFTFVLPYASESHPSSPAQEWNIVLPDGRIVTGQVPAVAGPLLIDDLVTTYGWVWTSDAVIVNPGNGVFAKGSAPFSAQDNIVINFTTPFTTATYEITLTPSLDSVTDSIPTVAYSSKSMNGFTINTSGEFTGFVDWVAQA